MQRLKLPYMALSQKMFQHVCGTMDKQYEHFQLFCIIHSSYFDKLWPVFCCRTLLMGHSEHDKASEASNVLVKQSSECVTSMRYQRCECLVEQRTLHFHCCEHPCHAVRWKCQSFIHSCGRSQTHPTFTAVPDEHLSGSVMVD